MKNTETLCGCGSGKLKEKCCEKKLHITVVSRANNSLKENQELLNNIMISSDFEMRYRGLFEFYGKDLIAYKCEQRANSNRNEFLRRFSKYMTDYFEDKCSSSWNHCSSSFWEEFIFTIIPHTIKITPQQREVKTFLSELKSFVSWLDKRVGTSYCKTVEHYIHEADPFLSQCEHLLNHLFLLHFPKIHQQNWNYKKDSEKINQEFQKTVDRLGSMYEVTRISEDTVFLTELKSKHGYPIKGLPCNLIYPGMILDGVIGRKKDNTHWTWFLTNGVYPSRGRKYIIFV